MEYPLLDGKVDIKGMFRGNPEKILKYLREKLAAHYRGPFVENPDSSGAKRLDRHTLLELIQKKRSADLKKPVTCDGNAAHITKAIKKFEAEHRSLSPIAKRLQDKRTSLLKESAELKTRGEFNPLKREKHGRGGSRIVELMLNNGRIKYKDKELEHANKRLDELNTVINELRVFRKELQTQELKSELKDRLELLRLITILICLLYALLNRYGRLHHGSQCDLGTIRILLIRSGIEANPGPGPQRNWRDLPTTVRHLGILSSHIAKGWEYYGDRLGLTEYNRDGIVDKYKHIQMQIYHMLKFAANLRPDMTMRTMLIILEESAEEFVDMVVAWKPLEDFFADDDEEIQIAVQALNEGDGEGQSGSSSRGLKRICNFESGESSVKKHRV